MQIQKHLEHFSLGTFCYVENGKEKANEIIRNRTQRKTGLRTVAT